MAGRHVLVVDESDRARKLLADALGPLCARVYLEKTGAEALARVRDAPIDIAFADLHSSGRDGIALLWELRQIRPALSAVIMAASASIESAVEAMRSGVADYLIKPLTQNKVLAAFERAGKAVQEPRNSSGLAAPASGTARIAIDATPGAPVIASGSMRRVFELATTCAGLDVPVLLQGELGVGKDTIARAIHRLSKRAARSFVKIDCAAITDRYMHAVLFGLDDASHAAGAHWPVSGSAQGGTLFLNDVDVLPPTTKRLIIDKLEQLHDAQSRGGRQAVPFNLMVATTKDGSVFGEQFPVCRALLDHADGVLIQIPPLRERIEDILPLAHRFLHQFLGVFPEHKQAAISDEAVASLQAHVWPGNVRELRSVIQHAAVVGEGGVITPDVLPGSMRQAERDGGDTIQVPLVGDFRETQRQLVRNAVARFDGNKTAAAKALGLNRRKLYRLLDRGDSG